jgi:hypothetical protein
VVKSLNGLMDAVTLAAGTNVTITPSGNTLAIASVGTVGPPGPPGSVTNAWNLIGNAGTSPLNNNFVGTTDNNPLELHVNGTCALRLEPTADPTIVNVLAGSHLNYAAHGVSGATIAGGGAQTFFSSTFQNLYNSVTGNFDTIGGGLGNTCLHDIATVAGGFYNSAGGFGATVAGGQANQATNSFATVSGGGNNISGASYSTVGGGEFNNSTGPIATVGGGTGNTSSGQSTTVGGGGGNSATNDFATIAGGAGNSAIGQYATVGGGENNISGELVANSGSTGDYSTVGGGSGNHAAADYSTVAGGSGNGAFGLPLGSGGGYATVGGGQNNNAIGGYATIAGGGGNNTGGACATIGGGENNNANSDYVSYFGTVGGGYTNTANGYCATVPGGFHNLANGNYSFAAGNQAHAVNQGAFVWADSQNATFSSSANDQFCIRAQGGVQLDPATSVFCGSQTRQVLNLYGTAYGIGVQTGTLFFRSDGGFANSGDFSWFRGGSYNVGQNQPGSGGQEMMRLDHNGNLSVLHAITANVVLQTSDRDLKSNFKPVNPQEVLAQVSALPITAWTYKNETGVQHLGPMAQDFYAAFKVGSDDQHIATVDESGVALAAIQGLNQKVEAARQKAEGLEQRLQQKETEVAELKARLEKLEHLMPFRNGGGQ